MHMPVATTQQPKGRVLAMAFALVIAIGYVDYVTDWQFSVLLFYIVPILIATWRAGRAVGMLFALLCGAAWFFANFFTEPYTAPHAFLWATINRLAYFLFIAVGGHALRMQTEEQRAKIAALQRASLLEQEILKISEAEKMTFGRDLHDGLCQNLAAIDCALSCLKVSLQKHSPENVESAIVIQKMVQASISESRDLARGLSPVQMISNGLATALEGLVDMTNRLRQTQVQFHTSGPVSVENYHVAMHLFRIAQEALSNAVRHSQASVITVSLIGSDSRLSLIVADNGRGGFKWDSESSPGMGLSTIRHRASLIGAEFEIRSDPQSGTSIHCSIAAG